VALSTLVVTGRVPLSRVADEIATHVPKVVASGTRKPIGAPGEATYRVTRGGFSVKLVGGDLVVRTPLSVRAQVCKPLGPLCPTYASCSPQLLATARVPMTLGPRLEVGNSRVDVSVTRPCSIAGIDVTSRMMKVASRQTAKVQRQIDRSIPSLAKPAGEAWRLMHTSASLGGDACLRITPKSWAQAPPKTEDGALVVQLGVTGALEVLGECPAATGGPDAEPKALPKLAKVESLPERGSVQVAVRADWESAKAALLGALRAPSAVVDARVRTSEIEGRGVLALGLTLHGEQCGEIWLASDLTWDDASSSFRLSGLQAFPGQASEASQASRVWLDSPELRAVRVKLARLDAVHRALKEQLAQLGDLQIDEASLDVEVSELNVESAGVDADGIRVTLVGSSKIEVRVR